jgi:hypothetical protein
MKVPRPRAGFPKASSPPLETTEKDYMRLAQRHQFEISIFSDKILEWFGNVREDYGTVPWNLRISPFLSTPFRRILVGL